MSLIGYARVSTTDQNPELQLDALKDAGCERIYTDKASGALDSRPQLDVMLEHLQAGDTLVIWKLDRLGRNIRHLLELSEQFKHRSINLRSLTEALDTSTATGRMYFGFMALMADFERDRLSERTKAGLAAGRARGRKGGRKPKMTPTRIKLARQMYDSREHTVEAIAKTFGVSRSTIHRHLEKTGDAHSEAMR